MADYQQIDLFSSIYPYFRLKGEIKVIELFAGIGSQLRSLKVLEQAQPKDKIEFTIKHHKIVEWAFNSIVMYNLIHTKDFTDYSKDKTKEEMIERIKGISTDYNNPLTMDQLNKKSIEWIKEAYNSCIATDNLLDINNVKGEDLDFDEKDTVVMSWSFPCQDISLAGQMGGCDEDSKTRSSLLYQVLRILKERHGGGYNYQHYYLWKMLKHYVIQKISTIYKKLKCNYRLWVTKTLFKCLTQVIMGYHNIEKECLWLAY